MSGEVISGYKLLRELGSRALPSYAAIDPKARRPEDALCVVDRLTREPGVSAEAAAEFLRDAKRLAQVQHANLVRVRDVVVGTSTLLLVTDWVRGELLSDVERLAAEQSVPIPLGTSLRILYDVLEGLSALHELRDAKREPMRLVHAEVTPRNVVVGTDGRSLLVHPLRAPAKGPGRHSPDVAGYLAPEVLLGDQTADQRADVYGVGVLLWEALMGRRMHADGEDAGEIVMRLLGAKIDPPSAPVDAPWAGPLAEAARRATAADPSARFANATEMLAEVRRVALARLAPKVMVAALVETVAGDRVRTRDDALGAVRPPQKSDGPESDGASGPNGAWTTPVRARSDAAPASVKPESARGPLSGPPRIATPFSTKAVSSSAADRAASEAIDVVEVVEMEVPPDRPSSPRDVKSAPPPLRRNTPLSTPAAVAPRSPAPPAPPAPRAPPVEERSEMPSKTDLAALVSMPTPAAATRTRWMIVALGAMAAAGVLWMLLRPAPTSPADAEPPTASAAATAPAPAPASASASASAPANRPANEPSPFDPAAEDPTRPPPRPADRAPAAPSTYSPPLPTVPAAAPAPAPAAPPPATAPHPKKKGVYDPQGI